MRNRHLSTGLHLGGKSMVNWINTECLGVPNKVVSESISSECSRPFLEDANVMGTL